MDGTNAKSLWIAAGRRGPGSRRSWRQGPAILAPAPRLLHLPSRRSVLCSSSKPVVSSSCPVVQPVSPLPLEPRSRRPDPDRTDESTNSWLTESMNARLTRHFQGFSTGPTSFIGRVKTLIGLSAYFYTFGTNTEHIKSQFKFHRKILEHNRSSIFGIFPLNWNRSCGRPTTSFFLLASIGVPPEWNSMQFCTH